MEKTKVTYMDTDSLIPYANNPRLNDNAVDAVAASIKEFGFKVPIVVDGLFDYQIRNSSAKNDIVLDLFGGSGTTIIACEQNGRRARVMEYDPKYADVIVDRWEKFTGMKAEKVEV